MRRISLILALGTLVGVAACNKNSNPTGPSGTSVTTVTVAGPDTVFLGAMATYTATVSSGAACTWGGDAPGVATVSGGQLSTVGNGRVTIWCEASGVRGTRLIRVLPNYQGSWIGSYRITGCTQTGEWTLLDSCTASFATNRVYPLSGTFTQTGDVVTGSFSLGTLTASQQSATIDLGGAFGLTLTHDTTGSNISIQSHWGIQQAQANRITGHVEQAWRSALLTGQLTVTGELFNTNKQTASLAAVPGTSRLVPRTLEELVRAIGR